MHTYIPSEKLKPFIRNYLIIECEDERINRVLPDTSLVMAFRFKGRINYLVNGIKKDLPSSVVSGLRKSVRLINYAKNTGNILVIFKEAGARAFFKEPLYDLFEDSVSLDNFTGFKNLSDLEEQLEGANSNPQRIHFIEHFLLSKLCNRQPDLLVLNALETIRATNGNVKIKELSGNLFISMDPFEKRFRRAVGVSPKQYASIIRLKSVIHNGSAQQSITETALNAGYFDQSHFNKDFKRFTGQTPKIFFKSPSFW